MSDTSHSVGTSQKFRNLKTALVFDDRMTRHNCLWDTGHIERPERYLLPFQKITEYDLKKRCEVLTPRFATEDEIRLVHTERYINEMKKSKLIGDIEELEKLSSKYDSIYINSDTYDCALLAAGCALELVSSVLKGQVNNGLALVRPPGHHAMVEEACGFCIFNNVSIAAKYALENFNLNRILIIDWDVHHGQGTQQVFYNDNRVLYFSIHRYESGEFWPNLRESHFDYVGEGSGQGFNINVPLNGTGQGNAEYLAIFNNVLLPIAYEYNPELVLVSAGYDAALGCPEGEMKVSPHAYPHLLNSLSGLANGRICVVLEGGYCLPSLSESVALTLRGLLGDPCPSIAQCKGISEITIESILNVLSVQRPFWDAVKIQNVYDSGFDHDGSCKHLVKMRYAGNPREGWTTFKTREDYPVQSSNVITALKAELTDLILNTNLLVPKSRTCFSFNARGYESECMFANHVKGDNHIVAFYQKLSDCGMLSRCEALSPSDCVVNAAERTKFKSSLKITPDKIRHLEEEFQTVKFCDDPYFSAGGTCEKLLEVIDAVATQKCVNGFVLTNPPGHYPDNENTSGYSTFNSVGIAAKFLAVQHNMDRVLIIDWKVQGSCGTQNFFYEDNKVLYISMQYYDREYFSLSPDAKENQVGLNKGKGYNINIPFQHPMVDGDYLAAFFHVILPVAYEYCPQFVLINLGYYDCTSQFRLSPSCFGVMTKLLSGLCNGKMVLVSEENLSCETAPDTAAHCLSALLGDNCPTLGQAKPSLEGIEVIRNVVKVHKTYWKCLAFDVELPDKLGSIRFDGESNSSVIKRRQSSDPVAIPKIPNEVTLLMDYEAYDNSSGSTLFCVTPLENCPHLELLQPIPNEGLNIKALCVACNDASENWVCLHCYQVYCGRFVNQHMLQHGRDMKHYLTLSFSDLSVWCYACDAYIHNALLESIKEHASNKKFNLV